MSERHLGEALLKVDAADATAVGPMLAESVLTSEKRRIRELIVLTGFLWALAIGAMVWLIWFGWGILNSIARQPELPAGIKTHFLLLGSLAAYGIAITAVSITLLVLAGLSTVFLTYRLRQATLRQINASLKQISGRLESLQSHSLPDKTKASSAE